MRKKSKKKKDKAKKALLTIFFIFVICSILTFLSYAGILRKSIASDCPESIRTFVKKYPEAISLVENYKEYSERTADMELSVEDMENEIPLLIQWDKRWAYYWYGDDYFGTNGCGPTCMAMVYSGLTGNSDWSPARMGDWAEEHGYYYDGAGTTWSFINEGAKELGLEATEISMMESMIMQALSDGCPIICNVGPGIFTKGGHYIVLAGLYDDGTIRINDPNSPKNSVRHWELNEFKDQVRAAWIFNY